jgi:RecA/RadA recombinase
MNNDQLDPRTYLQLLHAMLRVDGSDAEIERTNRVMDWLARTRKNVDGVCSRDEMGMVSLVWLGWTEHKQTPTRETMTTLVENTHQPKVLLDLLDGYDKCVVDLKTLTHADMDYYLAERVRDFEQRALQSVLTQANIILTGSIPNPAATKFNGLQENLSGTRDALSYVMERIHKGILINEVRPPSGELSEHADLIVTNYDKNKEAKENGKLFIPTGIPIIDKTMGGLRRKEVTGILGYVGQRKTTVLRTMAYNAAKAGFRVLHIALETDYNDELAAYGIMHTHAEGSFNVPLLSRARYDEAALTEAEYDVLRIEITPDFKKTIGKKLLVVEIPKLERTWATVRSLIERENSKEPLDLVAIDYLTLINDPDARDQIQAKTMMIQDVKELALHTGDYGFAFITPVQGNRAGYEDAQEHDGAWDITGIATYSELDKSMDNCLYVYTDDSISADGKMKIGSCKRRRGANIPATFVEVHSESGMVGLAKNGCFKAPTEATPEKPPVVYTREAYYSFMEPK